MHNDSGDFNTIFHRIDNQLLAEEKPSGEIQFFHPDHLGSTNLITDALKNVVGYTDYTPFGEILRGGDTRFLFTGQEHDDTGLNYYGARYYSPQLRRFTQPDSIIQNIYDPQNLNRYAYVRNNPIKYTDPTGNILCGGICMGIASFIATTSPIWMPYLFAYTTSASINDLGTAVKEPTVGNVIWGGVAAFDLLTPGIPEGKIAKGGITTGKSILGKVGDFFRKSKMGKRGQAPLLGRSAKELINQPSVTRKVKTLMQEGEVTVSSINEANAVRKAFDPNLQKVKGAAPGKTRDFPKNSYKSDFEVDKSRRIVNHAEGTAHANNKHINIIDKFGDKFTIVIDDLAGHIK